MLNFFLHKIPVSKRLLAFSLLIICSTASAQEEVTVTDSVYATDVEEDSSYFDRLSFGDTPFYKPHSLHDSVLDNLKKDEAFWYVDKTPERKKVREEQASEPQGLPFYLQDWFRTLLWVIIVGAFVAVLVWFLIASEVRLFRKKPSLVHNMTDDFLPEDIFSIDYEKELAKASSQKNYHLGVRLMYLHILKLFADREIIDYRAEKTNSDYLMQAYNSPYYKDFFRLTRNFEYVWYGQFPIEERAFQRIGEDYQTLKSRLL